MAVGCNWLTQQLPIRLVQKANLFCMYGQIGMQTKHEVIWTACQGLHPALLPCDAVGSVSWLRHFTAGRTFHSRKQYAVPALVFSVMFMTFFACEPSHQGFYTYQKQLRTHAVHRFYNIACNASKQQATSSTFLDFPHQHLAFCRQHKTFRKPRNMSANSYMTYRPRAAYIYRRISPFVYSSLKETALCYMPAKIGRTAMEFSLSCSGSLCFACDLQLRSCKVLLPTLHDVAGALKRAWETIEDFVLRKT